MNDDSSNRGVGAFVRIDRMRIERDETRDRDGFGTDDDDDDDMTKGKDPVTTTTTTTKEGEKPGATDKYPGIEGATRGEVDAFLEALDDFQPVVRL